MNGTARLALGVAMAFAATTANAATVVKWVDLTSVPRSTQNVVGTVDGISALYTSGFTFSKIVGGGTDYWVDNGYTQGLVNRPVGTDLIALDIGGSRKISFGQRVKDVYIAFTSWNGVTAQFDAPFTIVSQGAGYWGNGNFAVNGGSDGFFGNGEVHGVLKFAGTFSEINFTDTSENWHGFTFGIGGAAVPEPASWAMMIAGFGLVGATMRRRRMVAA